MMHPKPDSQSASESNGFSLEIMHLLGPDMWCNFSCDVARNKIFWGCHTIQFVARNVAKVELDSTSATFASNVARKVASCVRDFRVKF